MRKEHEERQCSKRGRRHNGAQTFRRGRALAFYAAINGEARNIEATARITGITIDSSDDCRGIKGNRRDYQ